MSIEQDPARLAEQRRRQQQAMLQQQYRQYVPEGATVLNVQDVPRARTTPTGIPPSEYEYQGGYQTIYYQPSIKQPETITAPPLTKEELKSTSFIPTTSYEQTPPSNLLKQVMLTPEQFQQKYGLSTGLPFGTIIYGLKETAEGYEIEYLPPIKFRERPEQRGRWGAEFGKGQQELYAPSLISLKISKLPRLSETLAPGSFEQGFITSGEMLAETFLPYPTPRPSYHKSLIDIEYWKQPPAFIAGSLTGEVAQSIVGGWVFAGPIEYGTELVKKGVSKVVPESVKEAVGGLKYSEFAKELYGAKLWAKRNIPYYYSVQRALSKNIAPGEMGIPSFERIGIKELQIEDVVWSAMQTPRMGGIMISKIGATLTTEEGFKVLSKMGGYWAVREVMHTPFVSQTQVTRMGLQPYIPRMTTTIGKTTTPSTIIDLMGVTLPKTIQIQKPEPLSKKVRRTIVPTYTYEQEKLRPQILERTEILPKKRGKQALIPKAVLEVSVTPTTAILPKTEAATVQKTMQKLAVPTPTIPKMTVPRITIPPIWHTGGGEGRGGGSKSLFGKWFRKQQAIKTPRQMMKTFFGESRKRRKK